MIKKIVNDPKFAAEEALEGLSLAYQNKAYLLKNYSSLIKTGIPEGKVGLLVGGGSGHEPLFAGFVGDNLADGAVCGNIFAAPTPDKILAATQALNHNKGVLFVYGNYAGDNMNFDIAAELAEGMGIPTKTVRIWDDVASASLDNYQERRGIAGDLFVIKVAGAAATKLNDLEEVYRVTAKARDYTRSIGVALSPGSIPETGEYTFSLGADEIEIGMGLHGEQGVCRSKMLPANTLVDMMLNKILQDFPYQPGEETCVLINNLGATTMMELLIVNSRVQEYLKNKSIKVYDTVIGSYCTSQEMAGFSISLLKIDEEIKSYYNAPVESFAFTRKAL